MNAIKETYKEVEITYNERNNTWEFILRGRERTAESLAKAKEIIDKPPAPKEKPFERVPVWYCHYREGWHRGTVTSLKQCRYSSHVEARVSFGKESIATVGAVRVVEPSELFPCNEKSDALVEEWKVLEEEIQSLTKQQEKIKGWMKHYIPPPIPPDE